MNKQHNRIDSSEDFLMCLIRKTKITSAARFEAYRRMQYMKNVTTLAIAMLSIYIISLNLLVFIDSFKHLSNELTLITVVLSTFVLSVSLVISQHQYGEREYTFHCCGMELNQFLDKLMLYKDEGKGLTIEQKQALSQEYSDILKTYNLNHTRLDTLLVTSKDDFAQTMERYGFSFKKTRRLRKGWILLRRYIFDASFIYLLLIIIPPLLMGIFLANVHP